MGLSTLNQNILALVALVVSAVALITTVLQVLQQYFSSAEGYRRCTKEVMGRWAEGTQRRLRGREFRVEVLFETPVIFLAPPTNTKGPMGLGKPIYYIDGTKESYRDTRVLPHEEQEKADSKALNVRTVDDERASWVTLLSALQREEKDSREWDMRIGSAKKPSRTSLEIKEPNYGLAVGIQSKTRSWDFVPASITRPYATTAMCHLVELTAMLGMYWRVFDNDWNLRAEGNGLILTSVNIHGLGTMVVFYVTGKSVFRQDRMIPSELIKELVFGTVPNIFDDVEYLKKNEDAQSLHINFGSVDDTEATLDSIGCQAATLSNFRKDHKHLFSVTFEIMGMIGKVVSIRGSSFRMIPNPTPDRWLKSNGAKASWKITKLMVAFQSKVKDFAARKLVPYDAFHPVSMILSRWAHIQSQGQVDESKMDIEVREAIHNAIDRQTEFLLEGKQSDVLKVLSWHVREVSEALADPNNTLNKIHQVPKEAKLMEYYFDHIRPKIINGHKDDSSLLNEETSDLDGNRRNEIWLSLIFRMLCWLMIHDWNKDDVCIVPSNLKGSRMPVFIG